MIIDKKTYENRLNLINTFLKGKRVLLISENYAKQIEQFFNEKYSFSIHTSEERSFLSFMAIAANKFLPDKIFNQINQM